jgi:aerobic-type carbon monoxide dehydrogenase small subunit (CoxS/CutS family)
MTFLTIPIKLTINGELYEINAIGDRSLLSYLHEEFGLTGTKLGCGIGECRACTVAVRKDPEAPLMTHQSCATPIRNCNGLEIFTIENFADGELNSVQKKFLETFAFQCGYCTPGFLMASVVLLDQLSKHPCLANELDERIRAVLGQHFCRCTGYFRYINALRAVVQEMDLLIHPAESC